MGSYERKTLFQITKNFFNACDKHKRDLITRPLAVYYLFVELILVYNKLGKIFIYY